MVIDKSYLKRDIAIKFENLINKSFGILKELVGIDDTEEIYFYATDLEKSYGGTLALAPLGNDFKKDAGILTRYIFSDKKREQAIFSAYGTGYETFIEIDTKHLINDSDDEIIDTIMHEILHHLTNNEEDEHGIMWMDLAKHITRNSNYSLI